MSERKRIVVLGAGFGGVLAVRHLLGYRFVRETCEIVLVDRTSTHVFTPWLYEVAAGMVGAHRCTEHGAAFPLSAGVPVHALLGTHAEHVRFRQAVVTGCDADARHVVLEGGQTLAFDALIIALGSEANFFGIEGLREHALPLKTLDDAGTVNCRLSALVNELRGGTRTSVHVLVAGGGPAGIEVAAEMRTMLRVAKAKHGIPSEAIRITVLDAGSRLLQTQPEAMSRVVTHRMEELGIDVVLDSVVTKAGASAVTVQARPRKLEDVAPSRSPFTAPTELACDLLLWCGGVAPQSVLQHFALPKDPRGRVQVGPTFEVLAHVNIFAVGDNACFVDPGGRVLPQTAVAAEFSAAGLARNVVRGLQRRALKPVRLPKDWPIVVMVGAKWGVARVLGLHVKGWVGYALRRGADLRYFMKLLPLRAAYRLWHARLKLYEEND